MVKTWLALGLLGVLVPAGVGGWRLHSTNRDRAVEQFQERQLHTAEQIAALLRAEVTGASRTLRAVADGIARDRDNSRLRAFLAGQIRCADPGCFTALAVLDQSGQLLQSAGATIVSDAASRDDLLRWARDPRSAGSIDTVVADANTLVLATPLAGGAGLVLGRLAFESLVARLPRADEPSPPRDKVIVFDDHGSIVFPSTHPEMRSANVFRRTPRCATCHDSFAHVERMLQMKHGVLRYTIRTGPQFAAVAPFDVGGAPWVAAIVAPAESVIGTLSDEVRQLGLLIAVVTLVVAGLVQLTWREGRRRLEAQATAAREAELQESHDALSAMNATLETAAIEWRTTVDTIDAALIVLDAHGRIDRMNLVAAGMLPGKQFGWLGEPSARLETISPWNAAIALSREAVEGGPAATTRVHCPLTGRTWDLWCRIPRPTGHRGSIVIIARDVTAVVELQESLRRSETMAALGSVVVGVAHEVRNPLFAISSLVDAWSMQRQRDPGPFIDALRGAVGRVQTLMTELLEYGRPSTVVLQPHGLGPVVEEAIRACSHEADARSVELVMEASHGADVMMDPKRLVRVFINIVQNAVQHAPPATIVRVDVRASSADPLHWVDVIVSDRGSGFTAEDLPRLFTPFFSRRAGGFGLGLAISERIVAEHRGRIAAANQPQGGGVMTVSLPAIAPASAADAAKGARPC